MAKVPSYGGVAAKAMSAQRLYLPSLQRMQRRQGTPGSIATQSPGWRVETEEPVRMMVPEDSWPRTMGEVRV